MELLLNLVWCAVAIAAAMRFARWRRGQPAAQQWLAGVATLCLVALLFPIISVTDDLHADAAMLEETTARRVTGGTLADVHLVLTPAAVLAAVTPLLLLALGLLGVAAVAAIGAVRPAAFEPTLCLRGPPSSQR